MFWHLESVLPCNQNEWFCPIHQSKTNWSRSNDLSAAPTEVQTFPEKESCTLVVKKETYA